MFKLLVCVLCFLLIFSASSVFAEETFVTTGQIDEAINNTPHVRFLPSNALYPLIRIKEAFGRFFSSSAVERAEFDFMISGKRLKETYMLQEKNDTPRMRGVISAYGKSTRRSIEQLKKAKSQNQEVIPTVDKIADDLKFHEILIIYLTSKNPNNLSSLTTDFEQYVNDLDKMKPGIAKRFKLLSSDSSGNHAETASPSPSIYNVELRPPSNPKRIIY